MRLQTNNIIEHSHRSAEKLKHCEGHYGGRYVCKYWQNRVYLCERQIGILYYMLMLGKFDLGEITSILNVHDRRLFNSHIDRESSHCDLHEGALYNSLPFRIKY